MSMFRGGGFFSSGSSSSGSGKKSSVSHAASVESSHKCFDTFLRRDRHGGFGIFLRSDAVIRGIEPLSQGSTDGRNMLSVGDTIVRVGGTPTPTAHDVIETMSNADLVLSVTVAKTGVQVSENVEYVGKLLQHNFKDPLANVFRVPIDKLGWLVEPGGSSSSSSLSRSSISEDAATIKKAAGRAIYCTLRIEPSEKKDAALCTTAALTTTSTTTSQTSQVSAALGRDLLRTSDNAAKLAKLCEASLTCEPAFYARAAMKVAGLVSAASSGAQAVLRPEFVVSGEKRVNVPALVCPEVALASYGLLPLATRLSRLPLSTHYREAARCLREVERREKRAGELAVLTRGLRDASVRELSETDLDAAVQGAFQNLHAGVKACRRARAVCADAHDACNEADALPSLPFFQVTPGHKNQQHHKHRRREEEEGSDSDGSRGGRKRSVSYELIREARVASGRVRDGMRRRVSSGASCVEELDRMCVLDREEAEAAVAAAECTWCTEDAETRRALADELRIRETALSEKAKAMAELLSNHAREVVDLADSASDYLVEKLLLGEERGSKVEDLSRYFDLADESMRARADAVRRQIRERERIIAAFDQARTELGATRRDVERTRASAEAFRDRTRRVLASNVDFLETARVASRRASMIKRAVFADADAVFDELRDLVADAAVTVARIDVELRLAHARLAALALRVEIERDSRHWPPKLLVLKALVDGVNSTKLELHRIREDHPDHAEAVEASLADLAELELAVASSDIKQSTLLPRRDEEENVGKGNGVGAPLKKTLSPTIPALTPPSADHHGDRVTPAQAQAEEALLRIFASPYDDDDDDE